LAKKRKLTAFEWLILFGFTPDEAKYVLEKGLPVPERQLTWRKLLFIRNGLITSRRTIGMSLKELKSIYGSGLNPTVYSKYSWLVYHGLEFEEPKQENPRKRRKPTPEQIKKAETEIPWETRLLKIKRLAHLMAFLEKYVKNYPNDGKKPLKSS
jgi:hypothetical protein